MTWREASHTLTDPLSDQAAINCLWTLLASCKNTLHITAFITLTDPQSVDCSRMLDHNCLQLRLLLFCLFTCV